VLKPDHARAHAYLGLVLSRLGEFTEARRAFDQGGHPAMARRMERLGLTWSLMEAYGLTALPRALITASSVPRSCAM